MTHRGPFQPLLFCDSVLGLIRFPVVFPDGALMGAESDSVQTTSLKVTLLAMCLMLHLDMVVAFMLAVAQLEREKIPKMLHSPLALDSVLEDLFWRTLYRCYC